MLKSYFVIGKPVSSKDNNVIVICDKNRYSEYIGRKNKFFIDVDKETYEKTQVGDYYLYEEDSLKFV